MTEQDVAETITEWIRATLPELQEGRAFLSMQKTLLPDVEVDVAEKLIVPDDPRFPELLFEQVVVRLFEVEAALMTSHPKAPDRDQTETQELRDFGARLEASLLSDGTLGGRVYAASPIIRFNYRLPFVQYGDGTRGRQMTAQFPVAEPVQPEAA